MIYNKRPLIYIPKKKKTVVQSAPVQSSFGVITQGSALVTGSNKLLTYHIVPSPTDTDIMFRGVDLLSPNVNSGLRTYVLRYAVGTSETAMDVITAQEFFSLPPWQISTTMGSFYAPIMAVYVPTTGDTAYKIMDSQNTASSGNLYYPWLSQTGRNITIQNSVGGNVTVRIYHIYTSNTTQCLLSMLPSSVAGSIILFGAFNGSATPTSMGWTDDFLLQFIKYYIRGTVTDIRDRDVRNW